MTEELSDFFEITVKKGCSLCGNTYVDIFVEKDENGITEYKVCCPNCGYVKKHKLLHNFKTNDEAFNFIETLLKGEKK